MKGSRIFFLIGAFFFVKFVQADSYLMRYPDVSKDKIVFSCINDLWIAPISGGPARRITAKKGQEIFPKFSPDGSRIAFSADYDGYFSVYVLHLETGETKRLTHYPSNDLALDWFPDGHSLLVRSNREYPFHTHEIYQVSLDGKKSVPIKFDNVGLGSLSPDGSALAYNRLSAESGEYHERKRYRGGQAQDIWLGRLGGVSFSRLFSSGGTDNFPMWFDGFICFTSDRNNETLNLYKYRLEDGSLKQLTFYDDYDVKYPSAGVNQIVFQYGEKLMLLDLETDKINEVKIEIPKGFLDNKAQISDPIRFSESFGLSPSGREVLINIRGELIILPADQSGSAVNLTRTSGIREKDPAWSPDGRSIAFFSDQSGEEELRLARVGDGFRTKSLTEGGKGFRMKPVWSPDSRHILFHDKFMQLSLVDVNTGEIKIIDQGEYDDSWFRWGIQDYCWSPDGKWVAYAKMEQSLYESIFLYSIDQAARFRVTGRETQDFSPSFSLDGKYLFFLSNRTFNPIMGEVDENFIFINMTRPYLVILNDHDPSPFDPNYGADKHSPESELTVKTEDFEKRTVPIPMEASKLFRLEAVENGFLYMKKRRDEFLKYKDITDTNQSADYDLYRYDISTKESRLLVEGISQYHLSDNRVRIVYKSDRGFGIKDLSGQGADDGLLDLKPLKLEIDKKEEYVQIFNEAWRLQRDWFYDKKMHGVDWKKAGERYRRLVDYCATREDLNYVIQEMMAELNVGHSYVGGGDLERTEPARMGLLGASIEDNDSGHPRIKHIFPGISWDESKSSPLNQPACPIKEGDYIIAINGHSVSKGDEIYEFLQNQAGEVIEVSYSSAPDPGTAKSYKLKALGSESALKYQEWVSKNQRMVEMKTDSDVAYIHIPWMEQIGLAQFARAFHPNFFKKGLIFDVRYNRGGFASDMVIDRLDRVLNSFKQPREGKALAVPEQAFHGQLVLLVNRYSGSAAEIFAEAWKNRKLGPIVGERTWGGAVGTETHQKLIDGGRVTAPQFGRYSLDGRWIIEGFGVDPDIVVFNMPEDVANGRDAQLETAIAVIRKMIENNPKKEVRRPDYPIKSKSNLR